MGFYEVAPTGIIRTTSTTFTYQSELKLVVGSLVVVPVGKRTVVGVVVSKTQQPAYETREVLSTIDDTPLPPQLVALARWLAEYYTTHLGVVLQTLLPRGLTKNRRDRTVQPHSIRRDRTHFLLNNHQVAAVKTISEHSGSVLLHGVTGSGKTAVYIESARKTIEAGKSVIVLVPEIALTSQLIAEFSHHFDNLLVTHSQQTEAERHHVWLSALHATTPMIVIGPRSALFTPLAHIGLIVIDEAHEPSFKQEQAPRYSALRAAKILANENAATLVIGSATPAVADYALAKQTKTPIVTLPRKARANTTEPIITVVDMTKREEFKQHRFLSKTLLSSIQEALDTKKQALIFHNRRGTAATTLCTNCGWTATDPDTGLPLTLHADRHILQSHLTGRTWPVPTSCPECGGVDIIHKGIGTKFIESELKRLFPQAAIARFDGDTSQAENLDKRYSELYDGSIDIIIGTQVVAKGLDLPHLRTVGIIQADSGLSLPDYGGSERVFQLLAQAIGRVGRNEHTTTVTVQSYQPDHPAVRYGIAQDYAAFYEQEIAARKRTHFPPFCFLLKITCSYKTEKLAITHTKSVARELKKVYGTTVQILGPTPAFYERVNGAYRWQIIVKSPTRHTLAEALQHVPNNPHWQTELDPVSLL